MIASNPRPRQAVEAIRAWAGAGLAWSCVRSALQELLDPEHDFENLAQVLSNRYAVSS